MIAHVILCNDAVKKVVIEDATLAIEEMETMALRDYNLYHKDNLSSITSDYNNYRVAKFWHVRTVPYIIHEKYLAIIEDLLNICRYKCSPNDEILIPGKTNEQIMIDATNFIEDMKLNV